MCFVKFPDWTHSKLTTWLEYRSTVYSMWWNSVNSASFLESVNPAHCNHFRTRTKRKWLTLWTVWDRPKYWEYFIQIWQSWRETQPPNMQKYRSLTVWTVMRNYSLLTLRENFLIQVTLLNILFIVANLYFTQCFREVFLLIDNQLHYKLKTPRNIILPWEWN